MCQLYTASQTNLKRTRKYFTKEISYLSYISSNLFFLMKPNIIVARHITKKNIFLLSKCTLIQKTQFSWTEIFSLSYLRYKRHFFVVHITYLKFTRKKMRKVSFHSSNPNHERDLVSFSFLVRNGASREKRETVNSRKK